MSDPWVRPDAFRPSSGNRGMEVTFLTPEGWFLLSGRPDLTEPRRVGSVTDYLRANTPQFVTLAALRQTAFGEAMACLEQPAVLPFCLGDLLPYLRSLGRTRVRHRGCGALPVASRKHLRERTAHLRTLLDEALRALKPPEGLTGGIDIPCAIVRGLVIPLTRQRHGPGAQIDVVLEGESYSRRPDGFRKHDAVLRALRRAATVWICERLLEDERLRSEVSSFLTDVRSLLQSYHPEKRRGYAVFHRDAHHQLLYNRGFWMLVRGPVHGRRSPEPFFVGVRIEGGVTRRQLLANAPRVAAAPEALWDAGGEPLRGGLCMGAGTQYYRLRSPDFTDAEAVVQWLDAGVILASGRSMFHGAWRDSLQTQGRQSLRCRPTAQRRVVR